MFRRKKQEISQEEKIKEVIDFLSDMEPRQMDRLTALAKDKRACTQKIDAFIGVSTISKNKEIDFEEVE